jgi:hypothetical protein
MLSNLSIKKSYNSVATILIASLLALRNSNDDKYGEDILRCNIVKVSISSILFSLDNIFSIYLGLIYSSILFFFGFILW